MKKNFYLLIWCVALAISCEGPVGPNGLNSLLATSEEDSGANCGSGGLKIESGLDKNANGILDDDEVVKTDFICKSNNNSLINIVDEPVGANCQNGGIQVQSGVDLNENSLLDDSEISTVQFVCNGNEGSFDEQVRLIIYTTPGETNSNIGTVGQLIKFDKRRWIGLDSVVFTTKIRTENASFSAIAELYDLTNGAVILNSSLTTNSTEYVYVSTGNIYNTLPSSEVDLTIRLRNQDNSTKSWITATSYLFLYRTR